MEVRRAGEPGAQASGLTRDETALKSFNLSMQLQTLYVLHTRLEPGFIHSIDVSIDGVGDSPVLDQIKTLLAVLVIAFVGWGFWRAAQEGRVPPLLEGWGKFDL